MVAYYLGKTETEVEAMGTDEFARMLAFIERERKGGDGQFSSVARHQVRNRMLR